MRTVRETPDEVVNKMLKMACVSYVDSVLEPSAGEGKIVDAIRAMYPEKKDITCIELNRDKAKVLFAKGYDGVMADFLETKYFDDFGLLFDKIVAAPPFKDNVDIRHIVKMHTLLSPNGGSCLVSLTSPYWTVNNEVHQRQFRLWLEDKTYEMVMLPDDSFMEKGRTVPTAIIKIWK